MNSGCPRQQHRLALLLALVSASLLVVSCSDDGDEKEKCVSKAEFCVGYTCEGLAAGTCVQNDKGETIGRVEKNTGKLIDENGDYLTSSTGTSPEPDAGVPPMRMMSDDDGMPSMQDMMDLSQGDCNPAAPNCDDGGVCKVALFFVSETEVAATGVCVEASDLTDKDASCEPLSIEQQQGKVLVDPCADGTMCIPDNSPLEDLSTSFTCREDCMAEACEGESLCFQSVIPALDGMLALPVFACYEEPTCDVLVADSCGAEKRCELMQESWEGKVLGLCTDAGAVPVEGECDGSEMLCGAGAICLVSSANPQNGNCFAMCDAGGASSDMDAGMSDLPACPADHSCVSFPDVLLVDSNGTSAPIDDSQSGTPGVCLPDMVATP